ncbi:MAG: hypothetical protein JNM62_07195 [Flavobacteriales bacterium]|nr:hypothetical protein [Flavobacteriales bacterium]
MRSSTLPILFLSPFIVASQDGTLDPSFNGSGTRVNDLSFYDDRASAVVVQPDGAIVAAGWTDDGVTTTVALQRLLPDGTPDPAFGVGGTVLSPLAGHQRYAYDVALQSTGAIVLAGLDYDINLDGNALLMRYTADGELDSDFGVGGVVSSDLGGGAAFQSAWAVEVMDDDRIVIVGERGEDGVMCARFSAEGELDTDFGVNGVALTGISFGSGLAVALQDDGAILAGGYRIAGKGSDWLIARFRADGSLDAGFGDAGVAIVDVGGGDVEILKSLSICSDGRIAACGYKGSTGTDYAPVVALLNTDGTLDEGFDADGIRAFPYSAPQWGQAHRIIAQADGTLLVSGFRVEPGESENNDFFLMRLLPDGSFDPTFAGDGRVHTDLTGAQDRAYGMAIDAEDRIVLAGHGSGQQQAFAYARYTNTIGSGLNTTPHEESLSVFPVPSLGTIQINGLKENSTLMDIMQSDGRVILQERISPPFKVELPATLSNGHYLLQFVQEGHRVTLPIVLSRNTPW